MNAANSFTLWSRTQTFPNASSPPSSATSLGKLNYCLKALKEKGWVKTENFRNSHNKSACFYKLTPSGITEKARVTRRFLQRKLEEHEQIEREIEALKQEVATHNPQT